MGVKASADVKIFRLSEPERGQTTLDKIDPPSEICCFDFLVALTYSDFILLRQKITLDQEKVNVLYTIGRRSLLLLIIGVC